MRTVLIDPDICNGQPVFEGTRITLQTVLGFLGAGDSVDEVIAEYPALSHEDILEALRFSSKLMGHHFLVRDVA